MADIHPARGLRERRPVVFTAHSRHTAFMMRHICLFVLRAGRVPLNPFMNFDYFLLDTVPRDDIRRANNTLVGLADELWTFGVIADGVLEEVRLARHLGKPVRHFALGTTLDSIREVPAGQLEYEPGVGRVEVLD